MVLTKNKLPLEGKMQLGKDKRRRGFRRQYAEKEGVLGNYFHYSSHDDKLFCLACAFYPPTDSKYIPTTWINGYSNWKKVTKTEKGIPSHTATSQHKAANISTVSYINAKLGRHSVEEEKFAKIMTKEEEEKRIMLSGVIDLAKFLSTQGLPFRGHREEFRSDQEFENRGNFLEGMDLIGKHNDIIKNKMKTIKKVQGNDELKRQLTLVSKTTQNEIIDILGSIVKERTVRNIKTAKYYVLIADECTVNSKQYLSLCIRYVLGEEIREDFLSLKELQSENSESITKVIVEEIATADLHIGKFLNELQKNVSFFLFFSK